MDYTPVGASGTSSPLLFATSNAGKLREAGEILDRPVQGIALELEELQTTDLQILVKHKTQQAFAQVGTCVLVEDTALSFAAWGPLPGPYIKDFLAHLGPDGLVRALQPFGNNAAEAVATVGYHDGAAVHVFQGRTQGHVVPPRGAGGFGWDPIFMPCGAALTFGEMEPAQKYRFSMRAQALQALAEFLAR